MTTDELDKLEAISQAKLPEAYRCWALRCSEDRAFADLYWFEVDANAVLWRNADLRKNGWNGEEWKPNLLCIGTHEMGDVFIDLNDLSKGVYFAEFPWEGDGNGEPYDPEDYSACWWMPFEQFARGEVD